MKIEKEKGMKWRIWGVRGTRERKRKKSGDNTDRWNDRGIDLDRNSLIE